MDIKSCLQTSHTLGIYALGVSLLGNLAVTLPTEASQLCPTAALQNLRKHRVKPGETLGDIARRYRLLPATIMGFNPSARQGRVQPDRILLIPPFNGIRVKVPTGTSLAQLAQTYKVRADVLFEVNGCQTRLQNAFIPGVNWSPNNERSESASAAPLISRRYPLPKRTTALLNYGWQKREQQRISLHSGIDLAAKSGTPVLASAPGIVAFVGNKSHYGQLIVINHAQGYQTRYAHLSRVQVQRGQRIRRGQVIGRVGQTGKPSSSQAHLHFELRSNSKLGWVAEDPTTFLQ